MKRIFASVFALFLVAGCGVPDDTYIADMSSEDRTYICENHTWADTTCPDGREIEGVSSGKCEEYLVDKADASGCLVTAGDFEAVSKDPCSADAERALYLFRSCFEVDDIFGQ